MSEAKKNFALNIIKRIQNETDAQKSIDKLNLIANIITEEMGAISTYIFVKADDVTLECIAGTYQKGKPDAVRVGKGVVGKACSNNRTSFSRNKDSFSIASPLKQWNNSDGVLLINLEKNYGYDDDDIDGIETICLLLSGLIRSEEIKQSIKKEIKSRGIISKDRLKGVIINSGYGLGNVVVHHRSKAITKMFAKDKDFELQNLEKARQLMNDDLDAKLNQENMQKGEHVEILDAYRMIANDKGWYKRIIGHINSGLTAEAAVEQAYSEMWNKLSGATDTYLKERLHDLRDIADRLRIYLSGEDIHSKGDAFDNIVIVASSMGPADLMDYNYKKIRALIIEDCTPTMHVAIVAKALNVPVIANIEGLFKDVKEGVNIAVDGTKGVVFLNPSSDTIKYISAKIEEKQKEDERLQKIKNLKSQTKDREHVNIYMNVGIDFDMDSVKTTNCDGVGLYRTELMFMSADKMPDIKEQTKNYKRLIDIANGKKVIFRSLDVGSDKLLPYWNKIEEENPAIGWRSIRMTLDRRTILYKQMRAFIKSTTNQELYVMFPMISNLDEFLEARETFMCAYEREKKEGNPLPSKVHLGIMIEVPSVVYQIREILKYCDFISVGTNDLYQFFFACDRGNPRLRGRYDVLSAPFLNFMKKIINEATAANKLCSVCGEMASNPLDAMALIGLGYRNLSVSSASYAKIKAMIRSVSAKDVSDYLDNVLGNSRKSIRSQLKAYAFDHNIEIY